MAVLHIRKLRHFKLSEFFRDCQNDELVDRDAFIFGKRLQFCSNPGWEPQRKTVAVLFICHGLGSPVSHWRRRTGAGMRTSKYRRAENIVARNGARENVLNQITPDAKLRTFEDFGLSSVPAA
jgi:hypothetical protein